MLKSKTAVSSAPGERHAFFDACADSVAALLFVSSSAFAQGAQPILR
jgi:hypothetical protein